VDKGNKDAGTTAPRKRDILAALFKSKPSSSASVSVPTSIADSVTNEERPKKLFWPDEYLTQDISEARVWTYGYNADAIGGLFEANNKNSVSQHGRDFAARFEREIQNEVGTVNDSDGRLKLMITGPDLIRGAQPRRHYRQRCMYAGLLNIVADAYVG